MKKVSVPSTRAFQESRRVGIFPVLERELPLVDPLQILDNGLSSLRPASATGAVIVKPVKRQREEATHLRDGVFMG